MTLLPGVTAATVTTDRLTANVLRRPASGRGGPPVVLLHGNISSSLFWQLLMLDLPSDIDAMAIDLRGFGDSETVPVDATRGVRDFSDDVAAVLDELAPAETVHLVGWSLGGGVAMQYALDHPVRTLTLVSPVSPYGFGGTRRDGSRTSEDDAGCGGGGVNPDFVERLRDGDTSDDAETSPRSIFRSAYVAPGYASESEDLWVASMLTTKTGDDNYPGTSSPSSSWPGFAAGTRGVLNTMSPRYLDLTGIVDLDPKPPVLWVRGDADVIVSDASLFDVNQLGKLGAVPGWPGDEIAPPQPMVAQTRAVLESYRTNGGAAREVVFEDCGHSPHLERPERFTRELTSHVRG